MSTLASKLTALSAALAVNTLILYAVAFLFALQTGLHLSAI